MAGIGFELRQAIREGSYLSGLRGYLYAAVISSGPWLLSVVALSLLGLISTSFLSQQASTLFAATITHTFAVSLITTGLIQMGVTRYLADQLYLKKMDSIAPTFVAVMLLSSGIQFVLANVLLAFTDLSLSFRLMATALYVAVSGIWMAMIFLSAARDYLSIVLCFAVGYLVSFTAALWLGSRFGPDAYLGGFAAGQVLTLGLLASRVLSEFELSDPYSMEFVGHFRLYPTLIAIGFFYNLALWIDKIVFWLSPRGVDVGSYLAVFPAYDTSFFVASLVIVPALAIFTVNIETDFYENYKRFYAAILNQRPRQELHEAKEGMMRSVRESYLALLKIQTGLALLILTLLTPTIMQAFGIPQDYWGMFRVMIVAMSVQVFLLFTNLILLYLDMQGSVLIVCSVFLATNLGFTVVTIPLGYGFYGYGFLASSVVSTAVSLVLLMDRFRKLEYLTFTRQPIG
ncbi:MAG: exopolysaccharide Pel transporter PelG [Actinomycetota bacterium]|nr:exopolysaccharide Pel transporter PelG [Actinomycetota bacterium]